MDSWLIHSDYWHRYLQFTPYDGSVSWAAFQEHAHPFSMADATDVLERLPADQWKLTVLVDRRERTPRPIPANAQLPVKEPTNA